MIRSRRSLIARSLGASHRIHSLLHSRYRVNVVSLQRLVAEDELFIGKFPRRGYVGRPMATVILRGRARLNWGDEAVHLTPGTVAFLPSKSGAFMRQAADPAYLALNIEWDPALLGPAPRSLETLQLPCLAHVRAIAAMLLSAPDAQRASLGARCLLAWLRAQGLGVEVPDAEALVETVDPKTRQLSNALDQLLSNLETTPQLVDLDEVLGVSSRQANRLVNGFNRLYGFNAASWQESRTRRKVMSGAVMATAPGMTTERLAEVTGYASPTALCRAFARSGLPSPAAIPARVAAMGG